MVISDKLENDAPTSMRSTDRSVASVEDHSMTIEDMLKSGLSTTPVLMGDDWFLEMIKGEYVNEPFFKMIMADPTANQLFELKNRLIWMKNTRGDPVLCIPKGVHEGRSLHEVILDQAHWTLGHYGYQRMLEYTQRWYWWPHIMSDMREFCKTCGACQQAKGSTQLPMEKLHMLPIPTKPWESIGMDFVGPFPEMEVNG